MSVLTVST